MWIGFFEIQYLHMSLEDTYELYLFFNVHIVV